ncbi:MAG: hypothetical protein ACRDVC_05350 [Acidimicrobiales bacterium]
MSFEDDSDDLRMAAASLRSNSSDVHILLKALCDELSDTLGDRLRIERTGGRFHKSEEISSLSIALAGSQFDAAVDGAALQCHVGHVSGGIRIRSEAVDVDQWILRLLEALKDEAAHSESARQALENIVIGGNQ